MQDLIRNIDRFLAAHDAGAGEYPADVMDSFAEHFRDFKRCPEMGLDDAFAIEVANLGERRKLYRRALRRHFSEYERPLKPSKSCAAFDMADNLRLLDRNYHDPNVPPQYRVLYDKIRKLGFRVPGDEAIRKIVGKL